MQLESAFETRRNARKAKKEGLESASVNVEKMKGIMQQSDREYRRETFTPLLVADSLENVGNLNEKGGKSVTFGPTTTHTFDSESSQSLSGTFHKIYNWWIVPWFYVLFRGMGLR
jgi:hypothetical protein